MGVGRQKQLVSRVHAALSLRARTRRSEHLWGLGRSGRTRSGRGAVHSAMQHGSRCSVPQCGSAGWLAGILAAIHPLLIFFSGYLLTETVFSVALLAALVASTEWLKTPRPGRALGAGLLWGVATLARPPALLLPALVVAWAWRPLGLAVRAGDRWRQAALLFAGAALVIAPWTVRNLMVMHAWVPVTTGAGRALLDSNN